VFKCSTRDPVKRLAEFVDEANHAAMLLDITKEGLKLLFKLTTDTSSSE